MLGLSWAARALPTVLADPWLVALLNLPALVIIVLAYVWAGLTEAAAIAAVVLNKLPNATVTVREGARSFDRQLDEMAEVFRMSTWTRLRHVLIPQLAPYLAAATRSGLSLVWKIVLIVELLGRPERRRLRNRHRVPAVRRYPHPRLCYRLRPGHAGGRNILGAAD